jgi:hypothetical protein
VTEALPPATAGDFLFGAAGVAAVTAPEAVRAAVDGTATTLRRLPSVGRDAVVHEVWLLVDALLAINLGGVLASAWEDCEKVADARAKTRAAPGAEEVVLLLTHRITSTHAPQVDLVVDGVHLGSIHFPLSMTFDISAAAVTVRSGAVANIRPSRCDLDATLSCEGTTLIEKKGEVALPGVVTLAKPTRPGT